ncbi:aspartyl/asparaginyl beta-hydroxylase domain-containing protein [Arenicella sp. 4NH20-0111]
MSVAFLILLVYVVSVLQMHYRGSVRFPAFRQLLTHTNYLAPYNLLMDAFSALPNKPILDCDDIDELAILRENWEIIRDEAVSLYDIGSIKRSDKLDDAGFNSFFKFGWTRFYLKWYGDVLPSACRDCPNTVALLSKTPNIKAAMFAMLPAGGLLTPHRDPFAGSLRYHLGLLTPNSDECFILVDGQKYSWRDGDDVLFDETFIHEAHNKTERDRIILFCDVRRPMRIELINRLNAFMAGTVARASATGNEEGEEIGFLNKLFGKLYSVRTISRRFKKWNIVAYIMVKYSLYIGLLYLIFF